MLRFLGKDEVSREASSAVTYFEKIEGLRDHDVRATEEPKPYRHAFSGYTKCEPAARIIVEDMGAVTNNLCNVLGGM